MHEFNKKQKLQQIDYFESGAASIAQPQTNLIDQERLKDEYKQLIVLKNNMFKVDLLLLSEHDQEIIQQLKQIQAELLPAIQNQEESIKQQQKSKEFIYSVNRLNNEDIDKLAKAYYEQDKKWYNARLLSIDTEEQEAEAQFIGYQEVFKLNAIYIKVQPNPDPSLFAVGQVCEAISQQDGRYYLGSIERITEEGYHVRLKKFAAKEIVPLSFLRLAKKQATEQGKAKAISEEMDEFVIPENLKILPTDNEQQKQAKKKKQKALKQAFKQNQLNKYSQEKQSNWKQFSQRVQTFKQDIGQIAESLYRGPEKKVQTD